MDVIIGRSCVVRVLMFPWLGHGHVSPFLELAKKLSARNFHIYLCSTPVILDPIREKMNQMNFPSIQLVELHLPSSTELPAHHHTTKGLPDYLINPLKEVLDMASTSFSDILTTLKPDLIICDFFQPWAAAKALSLNIPTVQFMVFGAVSLSLGLTAFKKSGTVDFPLRCNYVSDQEEDAILSMGDRVLQCLERSSNIMLINSFREIEAKYIDDLSVLTSKTIVSVGPLVQDPTEEDENREITEWLNKKEPSSVVFVSFGSENYLSKNEREELAYGLLLSGVNFLWALKFPHGEKISVKEALPQGFLEMVGEKGLMVEEWAPQKRILDHPSTGGFLSHCGWNSVTESMKFGVPIIAMPIKLDQPVNSRLIAEIGVSMEIKRGENGMAERKEVAKVIKAVMGEQNGEQIRKKAKELSDKLRYKGDTQIDEVLYKLVQLWGMDK